MNTTQFYESVALVTQWVRLIDTAAMMQLQWDTLKSNRKHGMNGQCKIGFKKWEFTKYLTKYINDVNHTKYIPKKCT